MTGTDMVMDDEVHNGRRTIGGIALLIVSIIGALFACGVVAGIFAGHAEKGGGAMSATLIAFLAGAALLAALCLTFSYRGLRAVMPGKDTAPRDRRNVLTLTVAGLLGAVIGAAMLLSNPSMTMFGNEPISASSAIVLALLIGIVAPAICLYWHLRVADEQDAAAYNKGSLLAIYAYWVGAPVWWLLWRGGLVGPPSGIAIYFVTIVVAGVIWLWAKYR